MPLEEWTSQCFPLYESFVVCETQAESIQRREDLLQEMESVSQLTARQSKEKEEERVKRAEELREQVRTYNYSIKHL